MKSVRLINLLTSLAIMVMIMAGNAQAALKAYGPTDPITTLPSWYQDNNNLALVPCVDQNGFCILPPEFDPAFQNLPITTTGPINDNNFPGESFYYSAEAIMPIDGDEARLTFVIEAAFLAGVAPDSGIVFLRTDLVKMQGLTPNSTYRVTHPYGTFDFTTDNAGDTTGGGGVAVRLEDNAGVPAQWMPAGMKAGTITGIGPYLTRKTGGLIVDPISGHTYIGDAATPVEVVGSPTGNNFFRIERVLTNGVPVSGVSWQTDLFVLMGRVYTGPIPSDLTISATYARDAVDGQVDIFATALPGAILSISGTGITTSDLTADNPVTGKYFLNIPLSTPDLPTNLLLTNSLDLQATPPHPITLVDEVNITEANYNQSTNVLTIKASSRDKVAPFPTLTAANFTAPGNSFDSNGVFTKTLTTIPPQNVTVTSSKGGSATAPVSVGVPDPLIITTAETLPDYAIGSLYNQQISASGGVPPYTWSSSVSGTLPPGINFFASTGRLFGTPTTFGTYSFSLQVSDSLGAVTIKPFTLTSSTPPNPVAVADTASTTAGSTVVINVVANDTSPVSSINPATLSVSAATGGSAVANLDGTVSYTAPASAGTHSFTYTVKDNGASPLTSNASLVTVTITVPPPVAPTLISPSITTANTTPTYTWNAVSGATSYNIYLTDGVTETITNFTAVAANCPSGTGQCTALQSPALTSLGYFWSVQAANAGGNSPWATPGLNFSIGTLPTTPSLVAPSASSSSTPTYTWNAVADAASYNLYLTNGVTQTTTNYTASSANCPTGTGQCTVLQTPSLADGGYFWTVQAVNAVGSSAWGAGLNFVSGTPPTTPILVGPSGVGATTTPSYTWNAVSGAASYNLYLTDGFTETLTNYTASIANCPSGTGQCTVIQSPSLTSAGYYWDVQAVNAAGNSLWGVGMNFSP